MYSLLIGIEFRTLHAGEPDACDDVEWGVRSQLGHLGHLLPQTRSATSRSDPRHPTSTVQVQFREAPSVPREALWTGCWGYNCMPSQRRLWRGAPRKADATATPRSHPPPSRTFLQGSGTDAQQRIYLYDCLGCELFIALTSQSVLCCNNFRLGRSQLCLIGGQLLLRRR